MNTQIVDLVLLVDSSKSMGPCFENLTRHLGELLDPLEKANFKVRFGLICYSATNDNGKKIFRTQYIKSEPLTPTGEFEGELFVSEVYKQTCDPSNYFTNNSKDITEILKKIEPMGDEDTLFALDCAIDLPFGPVSSTRRVIALFTDEILENGVSGAEPIAKIPDLIKKLMDRRIQLFVSAPTSPALEELGSLDFAQIEVVTAGGGLKSVDFKKLLLQMGKTISITSLQTDREPVWQKALFAQDKFTRCTVNSWEGS